MFSKDLEYTIGQCYKRAREARDEYMTVEHLLLSLIDNPSAEAVLKACGADFHRLRSDLEQAILTTVSKLDEGDGRDTQPTLGFQRVLQRAVFHVQSSGKREVQGANVLVAIFSEQESQAVYFLRLQNVARLDVINYISHGISKVSEQSGVTPQSGEQHAEEGGEEGAEASLLSQFATNLNVMARQGHIDPLVGREAEIERRRAMSTSPIPSR